jgi:glycine C-acetyltransferase
MLDAAARDAFAAALAEIDAAGLTKDERVIDSPQGARVTLADGREVVNFCANNYLGLAAHPRVVAAAREALDRWGYGLSSVRFICGTQAVHRELEVALSGFLGTDDTILYTSCFDANTGLFETLLGEGDAIISDALNHASIIDGIRLCKRAERLVFRHGDMADLAEKLAATAGRRVRLIATDGVFSMDGDVARLDAICELADRHRALVMVDDSHAVGFWGDGGRGTPAHHGVADRVDLVTGTLGKALGGASGGYTSGRAEIVALLRQRSRPYLFSNSLAPPIAAASLAALALVRDDPAPRRRLAENTASFRAGMAAAGFAIAAGEHPIVPIMLGEATVAARLAARLLELGIYVVGFSYPVVPRGAARIRCQISAAHTREDLDRAIAAFATAKAEMGI